MNGFPSELKGVEFSLVRFQLEIQESCQLSREDVLRLRRGLRQAAGHVLVGRDGVSRAESERFAALFDPPLSADPIALRRYQRPAPPFAILPGEGPKGGYEAGDLFELPVVFWGKGVHSLGDFARTLQVLGRLGLRRGEGLFEMTGIAAVDSAGNQRNIWREKQDLNRLAPPLCDALWWLETAAPSGLALRIEFVTPARLLSCGKPLFRASFVRLFPFILRRVTSMIYAHCGLEIATDPHPLLAAAERVIELENRLEWEDWRNLEGEGKSQDFGGIGGSLKLGGEAIAEILWVLNLGSLLNLGKGAAFGAGHYRLRPEGTVGPGT
jgi:hypothetical protein